MKLKKPIFQGCATAIVTPFKDSKIDFETFCRLIDFQIEQGVSALVVLGTTGESPTVTYEEREELICVAVEKIAHRVPLIVGTGSNDTKRAVNLTQGAQKLGADAVLVVTPYYNKATENGLSAHFKAVASESDLPIILYNIPSRTGVRISERTLEALCDTQSIVAVKEASGDIGELERKIARFGNRFDFYSGCDELILPAYSLGGKGVISAVANVIPDKISTLCALFEQKRIDEAIALARKISPIISEMFAEVNPIPVKCALSLMGMCENELRLPLTPSTRAEQIRRVLAELCRGAHSRQKKKADTVSAF